jgi:hypothetical protein
MLEPTSYARSARQSAYERDALCITFSFKFFRERHGEIERVESDLPVVSEERYRRQS